MIMFSWGFFVAAAVFLLTLPINWIISLVTAAIIHEICHILAVYVLGGRILKMEIQFVGCRIDTTPIGEWKQFISILAGPMGSFLLLFLCRIAPKIAICGALQGLCNLIPVMPLDGGRLLQLLLYHLCPTKAKKIADFVAVFVCISVNIIALWFSIGGDMGPAPFLLAFVWSLKVLPRKIPCKAAQIKVQ